MCNTFGVVLFMCIPFVQDPANNLLPLAVLYGASSFGLSWVGIRDAYAVTALEKLAGSASSGARMFGRVRKFSAVGWGVSGMCTGIIQDGITVSGVTVGGTNGVFIFFGCMQLVLMIMVLFFVKPEPVDDDEDIDETPQVDDTSKRVDVRSGDMAGVLRQKFVLLFFANVLVYGVCVSLQEVFEFVYLLDSFKGVSNTLLGMTLLVMTVSEIPVFHFADRLIGLGFIPLYTICQILMAIRCMLYTMVPTDMPWLILLIEPLHGCTFAAMWAASVEFGRQISPKGCRSRVQALVSGTYFQVSQGVGALAWGAVIANIGFRPSYQACASLLLGWSLLWNIAVRMSGSNVLTGSVSEDACGPQSAVRQLRRLSTASFYRRMVPTGGRPLQGEPDTPYTPLAKTGKPGKPWD